MQDKSNFSDSDGSNVASEKSVKHNWENQKKFIQFLDHKKVKNCLVYKPISWSQKDWDNIAPIVPKFILHLDHYMEGIVAFSHH